MHVKKFITILPCIKVGAFLCALGCMTNGHSALLAVDGTERYGGIGAELNRKGDYPTVVGIVPGGPADLQGLLDVSDKIIGVGPTNNQVIDVVGWPLRDVIAL